MCVLCNLLEVYLNEYNKVKSSSHGWYDVGMTDIIKVHTVMNKIFLGQAFNQCAIKFNSGFKSESKQV